ncbi:unnamed protein product [Arctia plantaginis]|uniref:G-protein coupled receptors family 1 profile domain-containing protein n=1 Tax=Arctia plantaginis TaxID=874455 RepID=A0A8S1A9H0_ARCPL|nr:unnamed protein product [Arctia plantaginis]
MLINVPMCSSVCSPHTLCVVLHSEPAPSAMTALHQFGAEMLRLSRGLEASAASKPPNRGTNIPDRGILTPGSLSITSSSPSSMLQERRRPSSVGEHSTPPHRPRSASDDENNEGLLAPTNLTAKSRSSEDGLLLPPPCTCPYFGTDSTPPRRTTEVIIVPGGDINSCNGFPRNGNMKDEPATPFFRRSSRGATSMVTWDEARRRGSSFGGARTTLSTPVRSIRSQRSVNRSPQITVSSQRQTPRTHHSRNSSVISRNSSRHGRILRLEQKATKVLGVVFFTFVILWAPFFVLNMVPILCPTCEENIPPWVFDCALWLGRVKIKISQVKNEEKSAPAGLELVRHLRNKYMSETVYL